MEPIRPPREPRFSSTFTAAAIEDSPPHSTSALSATMRACDAWLTYCTNNASRSPGVNTPTASAVTGHCVIHCTAEPKRAAPQKIN